MFNLKYRISYHLITQHQEDVFFRVVMSVKISWEIFVDLHENDSKKKNLVIYEGSGISLRSFLTCGPLLLDWNVSEVIIKKGWLT